MSSVPAAGSAAHVQVCSRCIYDSTILGIRFDPEGVCSFCRQVDELQVRYGTGTAAGEEAFAKIVSDIKRAGKGRKYDCVIGVSGGTDSSYLLMKALEWGLRPLAVHYDNTWNSAVASENIRKVTTSLKVDLHTHVIDNRESEDMYRGICLSGVPEFDAATDIALVQTIRSAAAKYGVKYILEGHSFKSEGISPMGQNYFDGKYIEDIHKKYGRLKLRTYPNMTFFQFMKWGLIYRQKFIRPLWYLDYSKEEARKILASATGWQYYGGHHLENRATAFAHTVWLPQRFGVDFRNLTLAASVRSGLMRRDEALSIYRSPVIPDANLISYVKKRLSWSDDEYGRVMTGPKRSFRDFKTYKKRFERLRPLFYLMARANLVPMSFYLKYCFPIRA